MNVLSRTAAGVVRRGGITMTVNLGPMHVRPLSNSTGIDKYLAPYPSLPKIEPTEPGTPTPITPSPTSSPASAKSGLFSGLIGHSSFLPERTASDRWVSVHEGVLREVKVPGNVNTGRSVPVNEHMDVSSAYRRLHSILNRNRVRSELFLQRRYEKPSDRERRLKSERHRRRFAAWIRKKVQLVSEIRRRG
ncbi:unnamed protein product [Rhizoctonia solani]|uniref:Ribosomal protein S21 n=1 Tax=Rhizoctonia solani TaxID=456999 RepID=A0A8H2XLK9_9AGAM|nr:unnamed protein product [Rhizoctonia solani]CAE6470407.1 unnamed protein product [Rhizoctonia solani]